MVFLSKLHLSRSVGGGGGGGQEEKTPDINENEEIYLVWIRPAKMTEVNSWELTYYTGLFYVFFFFMVHVTYLWEKV